MTTHTKIFRGAPLSVAFMTLGLFALSTMPTPLRAASSAWTVAGVGDWVNGANWVGGMAPGAGGEAAGFIGLPSMGGVITSSSDVTIGSLDVDIPGIGNTLTIDFGTIVSHTLTFDNSGADAYISAGSTLNVNTPIILMNSQLNIDPQSNTTITFNLSSSAMGGIGEMGGAQSVTITGVPGDLTSQVVYATPNAYTGITTVNATLSCTSANTIQGNLLVNPLGTLDCSTVSNVFYNPSSTIADVEGTLTNGIGMSQHLAQLHVIDKGSVNASSFVLTDSSLSSPLTMGGGTIAVDSLIFQNGGTITYDPTLSDTLSTIGPSSSAINIDLGSNTVDLNVPPLLTSFAGDVSLAFINANFQNGALTKSGSGTVALTATTTIPSFTVNAGAVLLPNSGDIVITLPATTFTISGGAALNGIGTLVGVMGGLTNVVNNGIVEPGQSLFGNIGTLTISGDYTQTNTGSLFIKGLNTGSCDKLVVSGGGTVMLDGALVFNAQPGSSFSPGDQIVVLDNTGGNITGAFSSFTSTAPPNVTATLVPTQTQIIIKFVASGVCPPCPPCPQ